MRHVQSHTWDTVGIAQRRWDTSASWLSVVDRHNSFRMHTQAREEGDALCTEEQSAVRDTRQAGDTLWDRVGGKTSKVVSIAEMSCRPACLG